jgi:hypothetical protein
MCLTSVGCFNGWPQVMAVVRGCCRLGQRVRCLDGRTPSRLHTAYVHACSEASETPVTVHYKVRGYVVVLEEWVWVW